MLKSCFKQNILEAGCDEAGRGCLAGPVVAAAVILPYGFGNEYLNDSKKLTEKQRNNLRRVIEQEAVSYGVDFIDNHEIDQINILKASIKAMHNALDKLTVVPEHIIVDGNRFFSYRKIPHTCIVKGDASYLSIAAASILAKTYRDEYMRQIHLEYKAFKWAKNKGYPTKEHREAIKIYGATSYHRKTFRLLDPQMEINF